MLRFITILLSLFSVLFASGEAVTATGLFCYDADGLPAFTQDGNMRRDGKAMFTLYDKAGRVVVTGTCGSSVMAASATMQMRASYRAGELGVDSTHYVTAVSLPSAEMLSATYYDAVPAYLGVTCTRGDVLTAPTGLVTAQVDRVLGSSVRSRVYTVNFYDKFERPVFTQSTAADNSVIQTTTEYDFSGNVTKSETLNKIGFHRFIDTYLYGYDRLNRPTTVTLTHSDGSTSTTYPLISNTYDNLGRLRSNGAPGKAAATFSYDKRSALTAINSSHFIQNIYRGNGTFPSKSGRITKNDIRLTGRHLTFNYQYDRAGRLTKAASILENTSVDYTEEFDYDKNTNIIGLRRYGAKNYNSGALLDDLTLDYEGNQLRYVTDDAPDYPYEASLDFRAKAPLDATPGASVASPFGLLGNLNPIDTIPAVKPTVPSTYSADYAYDANGNMTQDRHSSITAIKYNVLNLPQSVTYEGTVLNRPVSQIVYDASGRKHIVRNGKTVVGKLPAATTTFVGDETRYIGSYIMVNDTIDRLQTPYGYLKDGKFHSYVFDYQGNVMAVVNGNDVAQTNLYYADGLPMNTSTDPTANAFKYTAKELSLFRGLPVYDYTARHTLPAIGNTFRTMDPLSENYVPFSPYTFCFGDPINFIDASGCSPDAMTRVEGALQAAGGLIEMKVGAALSSTGVGAVVGVPLVVHGADNVATGGTKVITGEEQRTLTSQAISTAAEACGASTETAQTIGEIADNTITAAATLGPTAAKSAANAISKSISKSATASNAAAKTPQVVTNRLNGKAAEKAVMEATGGKPKTFQTPLGRRDVDVFVPNTPTAIEVKTGKVSRTSHTMSQINNDVNLLNSGTVQSVEWHFYPSPITGQVGPTGPLEQMLKQNNIGITIVNP